MGWEGDPAWTQQQLRRLLALRRRLLLPLAGCLLALGWLLTDVGGHLTFPRDYLLVFTWFDGAFRLRPTLHLAPFAFYASLMGSLVCGGRCYALSYDIGQLRAKLAGTHRQAAAIARRSTDHHAVRG